MADQTYDISLPGIEMPQRRREWRLHTRLTFSNNIESGNASVTGGTGNVSGSPTFSGNTMTVNLTGVTSSAVAR